MRVPVSAAIAFARAGATEGTDTSPTPVAILDGLDEVDLDPRDGAHARDRVAVEVLGDDLAAVAEHDLAPRRGAEPEQEPAFDLGADEVRVDGDAAVEDEHDPVDMDAPARIERDLGHVGAVAEEAGAGDPARAALGWSACPSRRARPRARARAASADCRPAGPGAGRRGREPAAIASSSIADSRANSVCELPTDRQTIVGTPDSKFVDSSRKFSNAYGGSAAPVVVKKSTPLVNITSRTKRQVHRRRLGDDLLVERGRAGRPRRRRPALDARPSRGSGRYLKSSSRSD